MEAAAPSTKGSNGACRQSSHRDKRARLSKAYIVKQNGVSPVPGGCYPDFTTAEGCNALKSLTTGAGNTALGWYSLFSNTTGSLNTGVGVGTLALNAADENTATGAGALLLNTTGQFNTANGSYALTNNTTGNNNTAVCRDALFSNTTGNSNTAMGRDALYSNTDGGANVAIGRDAHLHIGVDAHLRSCPTTSCSPTHSTLISVLSCCARYAGGLPLVPPGQRGRETRQPLRALRVVTPSVANRKCRQKPLRTFCKLPTA